MKIGVDIRALMEGRTTGVQVYIVNLLRALFARDQKNRYVLFANAFARIASRVKVFEFPNVEYRLFRYPNKMFMLGQRWFGAPRIDRLLGGVDLFFSPHWRTAALSDDVPLVVTFHDLSFEIVPEFFTLRQRLWHRFMDYRSAAKKASHILAVSRNTKRDLMELYGVPSEKIRVIYPGVPSLKPAARRVDGQAPDGHFLHFGTFEPRKNLNAVLAAYEEYYRKSSRKRGLILAGNRGWKTHFAIPQRLRAAVQIRREVSEEERAFLYGGAFALLFLSFYEGFGFPVMEAAAAGVPVVASYATSISEIGGGFTLLVNPFRPSQVAEAMLNLEADEHLRESLQISGRRAVEKFTWAEAADETLAIFEGLRRS